MTSLLAHESKLFQNRFDLAVSSRRHKVKVTRHEPPIRCGTPDLLLKEMLAERGRHKTLH